jgi:predicted protein tyrosine phosphatase
VAEVLARAYLAIQGHRLEEHGCGFRFRATGPATSPGPRLLAHDEEEHAAALAERGALADAIAALGNDAD